MRRIGQANLLNKAAPYVSGSQVYATAGTYTFYPTWTGNHTIKLWGGGGAGGGMLNSTGGKGGGAGGQFAQKVVFLTIGMPYTVVVADQRTGTTGLGSAGYDSTFAPMGETNLVVAKGGNPNSGMSGNVGGLGSTTGGVGDTVYAGGNGADGTTLLGGGGGGGAGSTGTGSNASGSTGGSATNNNGGPGGNGTPSGTTSAPTNGYYSGGGGAGARSGTAATKVGSNGAYGRAEISW